MDEFRTVAEVAAILKLNQQSVRKNWIDQGSLPAVRVGRRVRIRRADFRTLLDESYTGDGPDHPTFSAQGFWDGEEMPGPEAPGSE